MVASGARVNESGTRALVEIAGVSIGLVKALGSGELLPDGAEPYETGVALAVERHTHTPDERHTVVVEGTMSLRRTRVHDLLVRVLALQIGARDVEADTLASEKHGARHSCFNCVSVSR